MCVWTPASNCIVPRCMTIVFFKQQGHMLCLRYNGMCKPAGLSKEVCLYAGADWLKLICQLEGKKFFTLSMNMLALLPCKCCTHTHTHKHIHTCIHTFTHTHTYMYIYIYIFTYTFTHTHTCTHNAPHLPLHTHTHTHTRTHAHTHKYTHRLLP